MSNPPRASYFHLSRLLIAFGVFILTTFIFGILGSGLISWLFQIDGFDLSALTPAEHTHKSRVALKVFQSFSAVSFLFSAFVITKIFREDFATFTGLVKRPRLLYLTFGLLAFVCMIPLINSMVVYNSNLHFPTKLSTMFKDLEQRSDHIYQAILDLNNGPYFLFNLFMMALLPAIGEELIFRGIILKIFSQWFKSVHAGVILSSLLFALLHFQPYKFIPMVFIALALGYVYVYTGSLWITMGIHFLNNSLVILSDYLIKRGVQWEILGDDYVFTNGITLVFTLLLGVLFFLLIKKSEAIAVN